MNQSHAKVLSVPSGPAAHVTSSDQPGQVDWGSSESALSPRKDIPHTVLFVLNRNGLDVDQLRVEFANILRIKYAADDVKVLWVSILGKMPEQPHAFITLSDEAIAREILDDEIIDITLNDQRYLFEISEAFGLEPKEDEDPLSMFIAGVPAEQGEEALKVKLLDYFGSIAPVSEVIFTRDWVNNKSVIIKFPNEKCAQMVARCTRFSLFEGHLLSCRYARRQIERPPKPVKKADKKGFIKVGKNR